MAFNYITFASALSALAARLRDPNNVFWSYSELAGCLNESLRFFQILTGVYKQKISFPTQADLPYYDLPTLVGPGTVNTSSIAYSVTDVEVANNVLAALLEPPLALVWAGTGHFSLTQLQSALQGRLNRFLGETNCRVTQLTVPGPPPPVELATLPDTALAVRRAAWVALDPNSTPTVWPMSQADEWEEQAYEPDAKQNPGQPGSYSVFGVAPLQLRLIPPPLSNGLLDCLLIQSGPQINLDPANPVVLMIPDDLSPALKWGALADLLSADGPCRDLARAGYCEQRYSEFVQLARMRATVLTGDLNDITLSIGSVFDLDNFLPDWQAVTGVPVFLGMCGANLACIGRVPDNIYSVSLWVCANMLVIGNYADYLQIGRDAIDPVLDHAQHIASFKMGGAEFEATTQLYQNGINYAMDVNSRLSAVAFYRVPIEQPARRSDDLVQARVRTP